MNKRHWKDCSIGVQMVLKNVQYGEFSWAHLMFICLCRFRGQLTTSMALVEGCKRKLSLQQWPADCVSFTWSLTQVLGQLHGMEHWKHRGKKVLLFQEYLVLGFQSAVNLIMLRLALVCQACLCSYDSGNALLIFTSSPRNYWKTI